LNEPDKWNYSV
jgi:hypothetical protein